MNLKKLCITEAIQETVTVYIDETKHPMAFKRKLQDLINCGMTEDEARFYIKKGFDMEMELSENGLFLIESEPLDSINIYDPYTGEELLNDSTNENFIADIRENSVICNDFETLSKEEFLNKYNSFTSPQTYDNTKTIWEYEKEIN